MKLELVCPDVYKEFYCGNFVVQRTIIPFSAIALDQAHEQNNAIIKGVNGAVGLLSKDMDSALRRWKAAGPEVCKLLEGNEQLHNITSSENKGNYTKTKPSFRKLSSTILKNYFSTLIKIAIISRRID